MFKCEMPVKFLGSETRSGQKNGKDWKMTEAVIFVPEFGRVKVAVHDRQGPVALPDVNTVGTVSLSCSTSKYGALELVWDHQSRFLPTTSVKSVSNG